MDLITQEDINTNEESVFERFTFNIDKGQELMRIDKFLMNRIEYASRTKIQDAIEKNLVLVNQKPTKSNYQIKPSDIITVYTERPDEGSDIIPEKMDLDIIYEDEHLLIINKPAGIVVHPGCGNYKGTMLNGIAYHLQSTSPHINEETLPRLGLVHRIDKNTSGLLVLGKNIETIKALIEQFAAHSIHRKYIALAWGDIKDDKGTIIAHIGRHQRNRQLFDAYPNGDFGKEAITHYKVIERFNYVTLIECKLETGRTHQIRVHMKYIGHPLFNDDTYSGDKIVYGTIHKTYQSFVQNAFNILPRHALHAKELGFVHPITKKDLFFSNALPKDFEDVINKWRQYTTPKY